MTYDNTKKGDSRIKYSIISKEITISLLLVYTLLHLSGCSALTAFNRIRTPTGSIEELIQKAKNDQDTSLQRKAEYFQNDLEENHLTPEGLVAYAILENKSKKNKPAITSYGDTISRTSHYLSSLAYQYAVTNDSSLVSKIEHIVNGIHNIFQVTGKPGLPARFLGSELDSSILSKEDWYKGKGKFEDYYWQSDVSRDQIAALLMAYSLCYDFVDNEDIKTTIKNDISALTNHILDNDMKLIDIDGKRTEHGSFHDFFAVNQLALLKVASHITGEKRFAKEYKSLATSYRSFGWPLMFDYTPDFVDIGHKYNDAMGFILYYTLIRLEDNSGLRRYYLKNLSRTWNRVANEGSPFFNFIYASLAPDYEHKEHAILDGINTLELMPEKKNGKPITEEEFKDIEKRRVLSLPGFRFITVAKDPIPIDLRATHDFEWERNPFTLNHGGNPNKKYCGADFLEAYWMGRYHGHISTER